MAWWTRSTKTQRGWVRRGEAKLAGKRALRQQDRTSIAEGKGERRRKKGR